MLSYLPLVLRITAILSAATACTLYFLSKGKVDEKDKEIEQVRAELQILYDKNESAYLEITSLQEALTEQSKLAEDNKIQLAEANAQTVAEIQESKRLQERLIEAMKKNQLLEETANRLRKELIHTEDMFAKASQEGLIAQLNERIEELTAKNTQLEGKIKQLESSMKFDDLTTPEPTTSEETSVRFTVQKLTKDEFNALNEETKIASISTENGILVLNADPALKLKPNMTIKLVKNAEVIAQIKIININGTLAIASILPGAKLDDLSKGNTVKILR